MGVFLGAAVLASGALYTQFGGRGVWCMALLAGAGSVLAIRLLGRQTHAESDAREVP